MCSQKFIEYLDIKGQRYKRAWKGKIEAKLPLRIKVLMTVNKPLNAMLDLENVFFCVLIFNKYMWSFRTNISIFRGRTGGIRQHSCRHSPIPRGQWKLSLPQISAQFTTRSWLEMSSSIVSNELESRGEEHYFRTEIHSFSEYSKSSFSLHRDFKLEEITANSVQFPLPPNTYSLQMWELGPSGSRWLAQDHTAN